MDKVLSFLFFLFVGLYLLGLISRLLLNAWLRSKQRQFEAGGGSFNRTYTWGMGGNPRAQEQPRDNHRPEGEITIEQAHPAEKKVNTRIGDYVDYEELK